MLKTTQPVGIRYDDSQWPLVVDIPPRDATHEDIADYMRQHDARLAKREFYGAVLDIRIARLMTAAHRKQLASWIEARRDVLMRYHVAVALVVSSPIVRGFVSAVYWVSPPPYAHKVFNNIDEAKAWVCEQIHRRRLS